MYPNTNFSIPGQIMSDQFKIESVSRTEDGKLEIVKRYYSNEMLLSYPPQKAPDTLIKEVYASVGGRIELIDTIRGKVTPARVTPETVSF